MQEDVKATCFFIVGGAHTDVKSACAPSLRWVRRSEFRRVTAGQKFFLKICPKGVDTAPMLCYTVGTENRDAPAGGEWGRSFIMANTALYMDMVRRYDALAFTHHYIFGFAYKGNVYMAHANSDMLLGILMLDKASRGAGYAVRFKPNNSIKVTLLANATLLCSKAFFEETVADSIYNRGEIFEKMVTEYYGQEWEKDDIPFTEAGDIEVDGIPYQIKFEKATFCNEKSLANMEK